MRLLSGAFLMVQQVKNLPAMQETQEMGFPWLDPLEEEMATHSSILAWKIPWKIPGRSQRSLEGYIVQSVTDSQTRLSMKAPAFIKVIKTYQFYSPFGPQNYLIDFLGAEPSKMLAASHM